MQTPTGDVAAPALPPARPSTVVLWRITERCDLGCHFCRFSRDLAGARHDAASDDVLRAARLFGRLRGGVLVSWLGGEPLLWRELGRVSRTLRDDLGIPCGLTTHGGVGSAALWDALAPTLDRVTFSLDGDDAYHDGVRQAPGLFKRLERNVARLVALRGRTGRSPVIHVNTVLMRSNLDLFERICETAADWGVDELTFNELGGRDRPGPFIDRERLRPEDVARLADVLRTLRPRMAGRGLRILGNARYLARLAASAGGRATPVAECSPGSGFLFVDEAGRVAPCSFTAGEFGVPLKQLSSTADVEALPDRFSEMRRKHRAPACDNCPSTQFHGKFDDDRD